MKLSVVMPIYSERATLREMARKVLSVPMEIELVCVNDGSRDGSREILAELQSEYPAPGFARPFRDGSRVKRVTWLGEAVFLILIGERVSALADLCRGSNLGWTFPHFCRGPFHRS